MSAHIYQFPRPTLAILMQLKPMCIMQVVVRNYKKNGAIKL